MSGTKISALPSATTPLAGTELVPIVQDGETRAVAASDLGGGGGAVDSVFGRTGAVVAQAGDYAVADITGLSTALAGKQDLDATLTALAGLTFTSGRLVLELTGADTFTLRPVGEAASTDIIDRGTGDGRYARASRLINTTSPLSGGGNLSADRTLSISANGIDDALLRQGSATSVIGRSAGTTGNVADIAASADNQVLRRSGGALGFGTISTASVTGLAAIATSGSGSDITTGTVAAARLPTFGSAAAGIVGASGGGTTNFLRADGTWAAPSGGGGGSPGGSSGEVQYNDAGAFAGAADVEIEGGQLRLPAISAPTAPSAGGLKLFGRAIASRVMPAFMGPSGLDTAVQPLLGRNRVAAVWPQGNGTVLTAWGITLTATGTATGANVATTNLHQSMKRLDYLVTTAATTAVAGWRYSANQFWRGNAAGLGGFTFICRWGPATGVATATNRAFVGLQSNTGAPTDVNPSTLLNSIGMGWDSADTNIQVMRNDGAGTATKTDLGASFPRPTSDRAHVYELALFCPPNGSDVDWEVTDLVTGAVATGTMTTDLPGTTTLLSPRGWMSVGGTSSVIGITLMGLYIETDL